MFWASLCPSFARRGQQPASVAALATDALARLNLLGVVNAAPDILRPQGWCAARRAPYMPYLAPRTGSAPRPALSAS